MPYRNATVEIHWGNVESRIVGPVPIQELDQRLNPGPRRALDPDRRDAPACHVPAAVFHPTTGIFLSGALPHVKRTLRDLGIRYRVRDHRTARRRRHAWRLGKDWVLRDYQRDVVARALAAGHGLIDIGTSGGKTLLAAAILAELGLPTLYLVTTRTLQNQTVQSLQIFLGIEPGRIGQGTRLPKALTVALIQSLDPHDPVLERFRGGVVIFDEGHHAAATTYQDLIRRIAPRFHYYLSAVPFRSGSDQAILSALAGRRLTDGRYSSRFLIEKGYACPVEVRVLPSTIHGDTTQMPFRDLYREFIVDNEARNVRIAEITGQHRENGRAVLVLVEHVRHGERLRALLASDAVFLHGDTPRRELRARTAAFAEGRIRCLLATSALFQEGISIDGIQVLVQAGAMKSRAKVIQAVGRGMRRAPGKSVCLYVDLYDADGGLLRAHARARLRTLKEEGFFVPRIEDEDHRGAPHEEPAPAWSHVPETKRFALVDGHGRIHALAECLRKEPVPVKYCKRCENPNLCLQGGKILWREESV